jgi:hypothetical protein
MLKTSKVLFALCTVVVTGLAFGDPVIQSFGVWAASQTYQEKASLYHGLTNGFLAGGKHFANAKQTKRIIEFAECLEKMEYPQAVATIDKYFRDHPELHEQPLAEMLLKALTAPGSSCNGKNPTQ